MKQVSKAILIKNDLVKNSLNSFSLLKFFLLLIILSAICFDLKANESNLTFNVSKKNYVLLLDASQSMSGFDPNQFRAAAMRLFGTLLPEKSHVGIYQFGSVVEEMVIFSKNASALKKRIKEKSKNVHAKGIMSRYDLALLKAHVNLVKQEGSRNVILISDGMLDSAENQKDNLMIKKNLIENVLPKLIKDNIQVHVIAPHQSSSILKKIARDTKGIYAAVDYADELTKKMIYLFDRTTYQDYQYNKGKMQFDVEYRAKQVSLIINDADANVKLYDPDGRGYDLKSHPENIFWNTDYGYQCIILDRPIPGRWLIKSDRKLDNRVIIYDDYKLLVNEIPTEIFLREQLLLNVALEANKKIVSDPNLLRYLKFKVIDRYAEGKEKQFELSRANQRGIFHGNLVFDEAGKHELTILLEGPSFKRSVSRTIQIEPIPIRVNDLSRKEDPSHLLVIEANVNSFDPKKSIIETIVQLKDHQSIYQVPYDAEKKRWFLTLKKLPPGQAYSVYFRIRGVNEFGRVFSILTESYLFYAALEYVVDMDQVKPFQLPQHLPLLYQFERLAKEWSKEGSHEAILFDPKFASGEINAPWDPSEPIISDNINRDGFLALITSSFLIMMLFLYIRMKKKKKEALYDEMYVILS